MNWSKIKENIKHNKFIYSIVFKIIKKRDDSKRRIRGENNKLKNLVATYKLRYDINGDNNLVEVGKGSKLSKLQIVMIGDNNKIIIGDHTDIQSGTFWLQGNNCLLKIGNNNTLAGGNYVVIEDNVEIIVGDNCLLSYGLEFKTGDSHTIFDEETGKRINYAQNIHLGSRVWIGANATILKGVRIADNTIVGAAAVVTKDVPSNTIVGGNPAKILKQNISWDQRMLDTKIINKP